MTRSTDAQKIIDESKFKDELTAIIEFTNELISEKEISFSETLRTILVNHINEMIGRKMHKIPITEVDPRLFNDISTDAMLISKKIAKKIGIDDINEAYVLSIHFESALMSRK